MPRATLTRTPRIPPSNSREYEIEQNDFSKGINSYVANDNLKDGFWRLAQNARMPTLGEYGTRKGIDFHSDAAGETDHTNQTSTAGADDKAFNSATWIAQKWTAAANGRLSKVEVRLKNASSATGTVLVEHWTDSGGSPGTMVARSSIDAADIGAANAYLTARYVSAPSIANGSSYWIVVHVQLTGSGSYSWSSTTAATTAKTSTTSGTSWDSTSFDMNFRAYLATDSAPKGIFRAYKNDGTSVTLIAHGTSLYSVDDVTGALTAIKTGLNSAAESYRFEVVNDIVYYVNGYDGLRKWDFTTESQVNSTNYVDIIEHKGILFLLRKDDLNRWDFSNFGEYEEYTSTDFIYVPAPKTGDPSIGAEKLNGTLVINTRYSCYVLYGSDNATFQLEEAPFKRGVVARNAMTTDGNYEYFLSDDGIYQFNGTEGKLLSRAVYQDIKNISSKEKTCIVVNKSRLYLYYPSDGSAVNDRCYVLNLAFDAVESHDTATYVSQALTAHSDDNRLLVASSVIGQAYWQELESNDYTNLGGDIDFELRTHYMPFKRPAVPKAIRHWKPRFEAQDGDYRITCQYAYDLSDSAQDIDTVAVQGSGAIWGSGITWGSFTWGRTDEVQADLAVPGEYRRIQLRYKHYATRQPHNFLGHTLRVMVRRLR